MLCPDCDLSLTEEPFGKALVDRCPGCGGRWFAESMLALEVGKYRELVDTDFEAAFVAHRKEGDTGKPCPCCDTRLVQSAYAGVEALFCFECKGAFVAQSELRRMIAHEKAEASDERKEGLAALLAAVFTKGWKVVAKSSLMGLLDGVDVNLDV